MFKFKIHPEKTEIPVKMFGRKESTFLKNKHAINLQNIQIPKDARTNYDEDTQKILNTIEKWNIDEFSMLQKTEKVKLGIYFDYIIHTQLKIKMSANFCDSLTSCTLLLYACLYRATRIVKAILQQDGNNCLSYQSEEGVTALHISSALGDFYTASVLIANGADPNTVDKNGRNSFHFAVQKNIETCLILSSFENIEIQTMDETEKLPIHYCNSGNLKDIVALLQSLTKNNEKYWIPINIRQLECLVIRSRKENPFQCHCGQLITDHKSIFKNYDIGQMDCVEIPTSYYGEIEFSSRYESAPYTRLLHTTPMETLMDLLLVKWSMQKPSLIISIYGNEFNGHALNEILKKGIWKSAGNQDTCIWIITNGVSNNLTQIVSEAIREFTDAYGANQMFAIAIFPWSYHNETTFLFEQNYSGNYPTVYYDDSSKSLDKDSLEKNHTHYLFIDYPYDADVRTWLKYRLQFEDSLSKFEKLNTIDNNETGIIPMCGLLINGSRDDLYLLHGSITKNKKPSVIVKGSGELANLFGDILYELSSNNRKKMSIEELLNKERLRNILSQIWNIFEDFEIEIQMITEIIENRHLLEIYTVEDNVINNLDVKILSSLLSQERTHLERPECLDISQLKVAISINRCDVAMEKIFTEGKKWKEIELEPLVRKTICENKVAFVKLFIDKGFDIEKIVTMDLLEYLYMTDIFSLNPAIDILRQTLKEIGFKKDRSLITLRDIERVIKHFMGEAFKPIYLSETFHNNSIPVGHISRPIRELFIWAILTMRMELAQLLWSLEKETLAAALFAAQMFRRMEEHTENHSEKENLNLFADEFENKAVGLVNECYADNATNTKKNLIRELQFYGKSTCIELASDGNSINFIGHKSCQELLDQIWKHSIDDNTKSIQLINYLLMGVLCPLLIPLIVHYKHNFYASDEEKQEIITKTKKSREDSADTSKIDLNSFSIFEDVSLKNYKCTAARFILYKTKIFDFYSTPVIKFSYATISYIAYLLYFTTMLMTRLQVTSITVDVPFIILIIWTLTLGFEEVRQAFSSGMSFTSYLSNVWNKFDLLAHSFFIIATICYSFSQLDFVANSLLFALFDLRPIGAIRENILRFSRFNYGISIFFFIFRIMQVFAIDSNLGPKVIMIQSMIKKDLGPFIAIILVFIISYSVLLWTVAFKIEDSRTISDLPKIVFEMFRTSFYQILGDLRLDVLMNNASCQTNNFMCDDNWGKWCSPILLAIYIVMTTVLLLNILIAMFSNTYEIIQASSNQYWTLQRYQLMREYSNRPPIPPPFIIIWQLYYFVSKCFSYDTKMSNPFKISYEDKELKEKQLIQWERMRALEYLRSFDENYSKKSRSQVIVLNQGNTATESIGNIKRDLDSMKETVNERLSERLCYVENRLGRLDTIEINLEEISNLIKQLMIFCTRNKGSVAAYFRTMELQETKKEEITNIRKYDFNKTIDYSKNQDDKPITNERDESVNLNVFLVENHFLARLIPIFNKKTSKVSRKYTNAHLIENPWSSKLSSKTQKPQRNSTDYSVEEMLPLLGLNRTIHLIFSRSRKYDVIASDTKETSMIEIVAIRQDPDVLELPFFFVEHTTGCFMELCMTDLVDEIIRNDFSFSSTNDIKRNKTLNERDLLSYSSATINEIYRGYVEDIRNTESSWIETVAFNIHQTYDLSFSNNYLKLLEYDSSETACWIGSSDETWHNPGNIFLINKVKEYHNI